MVNFSLEAVASFLVKQYDMTSQEAMQKAERIVDLHRRGISQEDARMYLKSGGWDPSLAEVYHAFLNQQQQEDEEKKGTQDMPTKTIPLDGVQKLLGALIEEFAAAANFRVRAEGQSLREYKDELISYIQLMHEACVDDRKLQDELKVRVADLAQLVGLK